LKRGGRSCEFSIFTKLLSPRPEREEILIKHAEPISLKRISGRDRDGICLSTLLTQGEEEEAIKRIISSRGAGGEKAADYTEKACAQRRKKEKKSGVKISAIATS